MSVLTLNLPASIEKQLAQVAAREGVSIEQLVSSAVIEKVSAILTEQYLSARAGGTDRSAFERALSKVPDVEPDPGDRLETA